MLWDWYSVLLYEASLNIPCNFAATSHDSCTSSTNVMTLVAAQRRWSVIELLSITWIAGSLSIHSFSKYYPKINIKFPNESSMVSTLVPTLRFQRDFSNTSVTFKCYEHLTWPYLPFFAFVSIMNFPINNNRKNLTFLLIYIIPTSVLSIAFVGLRPEPFAPYRILS